ncbi:TRAP transporter substrate-binding protein [Microvirga massiliensis]|uniref:TRAP transporter substrate-binding protein n=1 Tax=Microvirga massiliensis TaxID=1033741 RepID=UPI001FCDED28|nr:TRAP transporter substrate-binding protein [Microvirga massiliensis]
MALAVGCIASAGAYAQKTELRAIGFVSTHEQSKLEREFYDKLASRTDLDIRINFNPLDVVGVNMQDTLRVVRNRTFDIVETTIGSAARDDSFLEGIDLVGVSTNLEELEQAVEAYRPAFAERVAKRFKAKVLTLFPLGPQVIYCNSEIKGLADLKEKKVRSYTPTMSALLQHIGASPVTLQFAEVYPALQRGVADCGITSPNSGNSGNWPEVTTHLFPLGVSWSVNAHFINLDAWNTLSPDTQQKLEAAFKDLEKQFWQVARDLTKDATNCNVGAEPCQHFKKFNMKLVQPTEADRQLLKDAVNAVVLPSWKATCSRNYPECAKVWNDTIGKERGYQIQ